MTQQYSYAQNMRILLESQAGVPIGVPINNQNLISPLLNLIRYHTIIPLVLFEYFTVRSSTGVRRINRLFIKIGITPASLNNIFSFHKIALINKGDNYFAGGESLSKLDTIYRATAYDWINPIVLLKRMTPIPDDVSFC